MNYSSSAAGLAAKMAADLEALAPGERLPSHRSLIRSHEVSATTVSQALSLLVQQGLVTVRPGDGSYRAEHGPPVAVIGDTSWQEAALELTQQVGDADAGKRRFRAAGLLSTLVASDPDTIDLNGGYLHPDLQPSGALRTAFGKAARLPDAWQRPPTTGTPALRDWFAESVGGGIGRQDVLVCPGGQSAIATTLRALCQPGDQVVVETPSYAGTLAAVHAAGLRSIGLPLDEEGLRVDYLDDALTRSRARVVVVQPLFQNPTGISLSRARRDAIQQVARRHDAFIVEDDFARYLAHSDAASLTAPMVCDDPDGTVVHIRSLTKSTSPNLRVGAIVARGAAADRLRAALVIDTMFVPAPLQQTALALVTASSWRRHTERLRDALTQRRDVALRAARSVFGETGQVMPPRGGFHLWVGLPVGVDSRQFAAAAMAHGVAVTAGDNYHPHDHPTSRVRISYVAVPNIADLDRGIRRLDRALSELRGE